LMSHWGGFAPTLGESAIIFCIHHSAFCLRFGGWRRPRESKCYLARVSGESPMTLPGCQNRFGLCI
jgi:hypothetical protein